MNLKSLDAAKYINDHLGLGVDIDGKVDRHKVNTYKSDKKIEERLEQWEIDLFQLICKYYDKLKEWKEIQNMDNDLYVEALMNIDKVEYYIDEFFINGTQRSRRWFRKTNGKWVKEIERKLQEQAMV